MTETKNAVTGQQDETEMVLVPRKPTAEMLKDGWYCIHDENTEGAWTAMIEAWEKSKSQSTEKY